LTIRSIINRGGEQGAQYSQALHEWFAHIPGLRVVMPSTVTDARDLLFASVLCPDLVMYIDDLWLYEEEDLPPVVELYLSDQRPQVTQSGSDITIVGSGHASLLDRNVSTILKNEQISAEVIDIRVMNPFFEEEIVSSVKKLRIYLLLILEL